MSRIKSDELPPGKDLFIVVTRHIGSKGQVVVHAYGPWFNRKAAKRHQARFNEIPGVAASSCVIMSMDRRVKGYKERDGKG